MPDVSDNIPPSEKSVDSKISPADKPGARVESLGHHAWDMASTIIIALLMATVLRVIFFQPYTIPSASMEPTLYEGDYIIVSKFPYGWSRHSLPFSPPLFRGRILFHQPRRGDIIVFKLPRDNSKDYIKRLIGLPGDKIQVKEGRLYINNALVQQVGLGIGSATCPGVGMVPFVPRYRETLPGGAVHEINSCLGASGPADNTAIYTVPSGCYFMMGDNRDNSSDSRFDPMTPWKLDQYNGCTWDTRLNEALGAAGLEGGVGYVPSENLEGRADLILFSWSHGASLFKPWTWVLNARLDRFLHVLR